MLDLIDTKGKKDIKSMTLEEVDSRDDSPGREIFQGKAAL